MSLEQTKLWLESEHVCHYCRTTLTVELTKKGKMPKNGATRDHVIPLNKGGKDSTGNKVLCCYTCNMRKGDSDYEEFVSSVWLKNRRANS